MMQGAIKALVAPVLTGLLTGCIQLGPDFERPQPEAKMPASYQSYTSDTRREPLPAPEDRWWENFNNPQINQLVTRVLNRNLDIQQAAAVIQEMEARVIQTRADRFPSLGFQGQGAREQRSETNYVPGSNLSLGGATSSYSLSLPASFELDLWGKLARAEEASRAQLLQAEENRLALSQSVIAEAVSLQLQIEALERRIRISEQSIRNYQRSARLVEARYERGLSPVLDVRQARRTLARAQSELPSLRQELGVAQQNLAVLTGEYPKTAQPLPQPEDYYKPLAPVPPGIPSELLLRRPDLRAAEAQLKSLNAQVGVAKASRFPSISLTGSFGYSSTELSQLFDPKSELWSLAMGLTQPIFDAGRLKAGQRAAEARYRQGVAEYAKTVLKAFSEVEGALLTRKEQLARRKRVLNFLKEARSAQKLAESRYNRGLVDYLTVLSAQITRFGAEADLVLVDMAILTNRVTLHRALGGGWGAPSPPDKTNGEQPNHG
ncbi:MAG: efflux transporter outer membrane subunit [Desulfatiglandaceae bacterium]